MIQTQGFDLGHPDAGRRRSEAALVTSNTGHFTSATAAANLFSNQNALGYWRHGIWLQRATSAVPRSTGTAVPNLDLG
jgi:hypothetical protein